MFESKAFLKGEIERLKRENAQLKLDLEVAEDRVKSSEYLTDKWRAVVDRLSMKNVSLRRINQDLLSGRIQVLDKNDGTFKPVKE